MKWNTSWPASLKALAKANRKSLFIVGADLPSGRMEMYGQIDEDKALAIWRFADRLYQGDSVEDAFAMVQAAIQERREKLAAKAEGRR